MSLISSEIVPLTTVDLQHQFDIRCCNWSPQEDDFIDNIAQLGEALNSLKMRFIVSRCPHNITITGPLM